MGNCKSIEQGRNAVHYHTQEAKKHEQFAAANQKVVDTLIIERERIKQQQQQQQQN
jgi:3-dehydroquinate synthase class II